MATRRSPRRKSIPRLVIMLAGLVLNALLGLADYYTGHELVLSSFYVLPLRW